jgi:hypothetical protein
MHLRPLRIVVGAQPWVRDCAPDDRPGAGYFAAAAGFLAGSAGAFSTTGAVT